MQVRTLGRWDVGKGSDDRHEEPGASGPAARAADPLFMSLNDESVTTHTRIVTVPTKHVEFVSPSR
jgi:hypothetical protein